MKVQKFSEIFVNEKGIVVVDGVIPTLIPIEGGPKEEYRGTKKKPILNQIGKFTTTSYDSHGVHKMGIHGTLDMATAYAQETLREEGEVTFVQIDEIFSDGNLDHKCDVTRDQIVDKDEPEYMDLSEDS
jgi:hypothetical protein